jgi:alpha-ketoglutarate-dependent 2,4-dichlorophenoxyacetate dioxygenase
MNRLSCNSLHPLFAAEVQGVDLRERVDDAFAAEVEAAMDRNAVLVFRDQVLDETEQMAFTRALGPVDMGLLKVLQPKSRLKEAGMVDISNVDLDSRVRDRDDPKLIAMLGNQVWHSDSSFKQPASKYSLLLACVITERGGETEFADMRAACDALPADLAAEVEGLLAEHSAFHSRMQLDDSQYTADDLAAFPPVQWPIVRVHPGSKRKTLFIGAHAARIVDRPVPEGRLLLAELLEHATQRPFVYRHTWRKGDLVMWDNRAVLHRGLRYDLSQRRELRRSTVEDAWPA